MGIIEFIQMLTASLVSAFVGGSIVRMSISDVVDVKLSEPTKMTYYELLGIVEDIFVTKVKNELYLKSLGNKSVPSLSEVDTIVLDFVDSVMEDISDNIKTQLLDYVADDYLTKYLTKRYNTILIEEMKNVF